MYKKIGYHDEVKGLYLIDQSSDAEQIACRKRAEYLADGKTDDLRMIETFLSQIHPHKNLTWLADFIRRIRLDGDVQQSLAFAQRLADTTSTTTVFSELSIEGTQIQLNYSIMTIQSNTFKLAALELSDWSVAEKNLETFRERGNAVKPTFELEFNSLLMDLHKDFPALKDGRRISEKEDKRISDKIDHLMRDFPIVDRTLQSGRLAKNAVVHKNILRDVKLLFEWMKSEKPTADSLANEVFADWDTRRSLLQLDLQEVLLEKQNTMLRIVDSKIEGRDLKTVLNALIYLNES